MIKDYYKKELLDGVYVKQLRCPSLKHYYAVEHIGRALDKHLGRKTSRVFYMRFAVRLGTKDIVVPDISVVCDKSKIKENGIHGAPDLVVEVLSRSTVKWDRGYKFELYQKHGVKEYWLVDVNSMCVEIYSLIDGVFKLIGAYTYVPEEDFAELSNEEKSEVVYEFSPVLFPDLIIKLQDLFNQDF